MKENIPGLKEKWKRNTDFQDNKNPLSILINLIIKKIQRATTIEMLVKIILKAKKVSSE
jgi:hypothetical protein